MSNTTAQYSTEPSLPTGTPHVIRRLYDRWYRVHIRHELLLLLLFCLALGLRLYRIDAQSLWADEGGTIALASRSVVQIAREAAQDVHPPLYYWVLHIWMSLLGTSIVAVRGLSAVCGALVVVLTYSLGRRWFGSAAAVVAAVAAIVSPLAIHYAQETRMYALSMLLGALLWWLFERWLAHPRWPILVLYYIATILMIATHYFAVTIVLALALAWLVRQRHIQPGGAVGMPGARLERWRPVLIWLSIHALLALLYVALVLRSRTMLAQWPDIPRASFGPVFVLLDTVRSFSTGISPPTGWWIWAAGFSLLLVAGLVSRARRPIRPDGRTLAVLWLLVPLGIMLILSYNQPLYQPRFLLPALPAFHLLVGHGTAALGRWLRRQHLAVPGAVAAIAFAALGPLGNEWFSSSSWRDDYRGIAQTIDATARADDAIVLMGQSGIDTLNYYYTGPQPRYLVPRARPLDRAATTQDLATIAQHHRRLYVLYYVPYEADPDGLIPTWLQDHMFRASSRWYGGVELVIYERCDQSRPLQPLDMQFAAPIRLAGFTATSAPVGRNDAICIELAWQIGEPLGQPVNIFVHLLDSGGQIAAQYDGPIGTYLPAEGATQGMRNNRLAVLVPSDLPNGTYHLRMGIYDAASGTRVLLTTGADSLEIGQIRVAGNS